MTCLLVFSYIVYDFKFYCFHKIFGAISIFLAWVIDVLCDMCFDLHLQHKTISLRRFIKAIANISLQHYGQNDRLNKGRCLSQKMINDKTDTKKIWKFSFLADEVYCSWTNTPCSFGVKGLRLYLKAYKAANNFLLGVWALLYITYVCKSVCMFSK